jgi:tetratricopeptide (TPR) repeat protein
MTSLGSSPVRPRRGTAGSATALVALTLVLGIAPGGWCADKKPSKSGGKNTGNTPVGTISDPVQLYNIGTEYLRQGRPDRAIPLLEEAVAGQPDSPLIAYVLGLSYYGVRDLDKAEKVFLKLLDGDPFFTDAHNSLGIVYADRGDWARARVQFEQVLGDKRYLTPEVARFNLGRVLLAEGLAAEAVPLLKMSAEAKPLNPLYRFQYGVALEGLGRFEEARKEFESVVEKRPDDADALYHLGIVSFRLQGHGRARTLFERVVTLSPDSELGKQAAEYLLQVPR